MDLIRWVSPVFKIEALIWVSFWRALKFQSFSWRDGSNSTHQSKNTWMKYKTHIKLVHELYGWNAGRVAVNVQDRSPHMSFILKGSQILAIQLKSWFISKTLFYEYRSEIQTHIKLVHEFYGTCFQYKCGKTRINHLTPLLVVTMSYTCWLLCWADCIEDFKWRLHFQFEVAFWKGCFERDVFWRAKSCLKGIEDFNLEHCMPQPPCLANLFPPKMCQSMGPMIVFGLRHIG